MFELSIATIILTFFLSYYSNGIGKKLSLLDIPNKTKIHDKAIPITGGLILFLSICLSFIFQKYINEANHFILIYFLFSFFFVGLIDDKLNLKHYIKILLILLISYYYIYSQNFFVIEKIYFEILNFELYFGKYKILVTLLCIILLYIAMNMADGINGLIILISLFGIVILKLFIIGNNFNIIDISIFSALFVLFFFNYKNKIFLGNSGTTLLIGYFVFLTIEKNYYYKIDVFNIISIFLIMGIDMVRLFFLRISNNKNPFNSDQNHFHYILLKRFNLHYANFIYILLSFSPVILYKLFDLSILIFISISVISYFLILLNNKNHERKN